MDVTVVMWVDVDGTMGADVVVAALAAVCEESGNDGCGDRV